jgi:hypothetical protein
VSGGLAPEDEDVTAADRQLTNLSGQALSFDANGNLLSDGQRNYSWDAENRMVGITYPGQLGKQTASAVRKKSFKGA